MKRAIIFDFGQTLANSADGFRMAEKEAEIDIFSRIGVVSWTDFMSIYRKIRKEFQAKSDFSRKSMWKQIILHFGVQAEDDFLVDCEGRYWDTVEAQTALFPEVLGVIEQLSRKYMLSVITNTQGQEQAGRHRFAGFPELSSYLQAVIVAGESGIPPKPDPAPFHICLEKLGLAAAEAVFVGDDLRIDILGAQSVGIDPIWLKHYSVERSWPEVEAPCPVITSLDQLLFLDRVLSGSSDTV